MTIEGDAPAEDVAEGDTEPTETSNIKVAYIADTDIMLPIFLQIRADPNSAPDLRFQFQNVTFLLNTIDWLTKETEFIDVRKHEPMFASLQMIDDVKEEASKGVRKQIDQFEKAYKDVVEKTEKESQRALKNIREELEEMQKKSADGTVTRQQLMIKQTELQMTQQRLARKQEVAQLKAERERDRKIAKIRREADQKVSTIQNKVKAYAVILPCIPPLLVGIIVFASRRLRERENISKARLK